MKVTEETLQKFVDYHKRFERLYASLGVGLNFAYNILEYNNGSPLKQDVQRISLNDLHRILKSHDVGEKTISISENKFITMQRPLSTNHFISERVGYKVIDAHHDTFTAEGISLRPKGTYIPLPCTREAFDTGVITFLVGNTKRKAELKTSLEFALVRNVLHRKFGNGEVGLNLTELETHSRGVLKAPSIESIMNLLVRDNCGVKVTTDGALVFIMNASIRGNKGVTYLNTESVKDTNGLYYTGLLV